MGNHDLGDPQPAEYAQVLSVMAARFFWLLTASQRVNGVDA
jgi:hypothetical protein